MRNDPVVLGLDLSLRCSAAVVIPPYWRTGWKSLTTMTVGKELKADATESDRLDRIVFIMERIGEFALKHGVTHAFVEQYAFSQGTSHAHALGELGGLVKVRLHLAHIGVATVVASQARKFLFGKMPAKGAKKVAVAQLKTMGAEFDTEDEYDAFVVANYGRSELGMTALALPR